MTPAHLDEMFGQRVAPDGTLVRENFARWFGASRIVGADGRPLVCYHGTRADFSSFDRGAQKANPWLLGDDAHGFFFTIWPGRRSDSGPWSGAAGYAGTCQVDGETVVASGGNVMPVYLAIELPWETTAAEYREKGRRPNLREELCVLGYDGIRIDDGTVIAFEPEQAKSATANAGTFSVFDTGVCDPIAREAAVAADSSAAARAGRVAADRARRAISAIRSPTDSSGLTC